MYMCFVRVRAMYSNTEILNPVLLSVKEGCPTHVSLEIRNHPVRMPLEWVYMHQKPG